jgi:Transposase DDE domain
MSTMLNVAEDWKLLLKYLPEDYEALAHEYKLLETQYGNAKITTAEELLRVLFLHVGADLPLLDTSALLACTGGPIISANRIHHRMRKSAPYAQALLAGTCKDREPVDPERWGGYDMIAIDGSSVTCPGAKGTDARLHAAIRLSNLSIQSAVVTDASEGETLRRFFFIPGQLAIVDRGYANGNGIAWVRHCDADVLARLNRGALPLYDEEGNEIDVIAWARTLSDSVATERDVWIYVENACDNQWIVGRLVGTRLPADKTREAQQRLRKEQGSKVTEDSLEMAAYVLVFTTADASRLSPEQVLEAYRLRWQVELLFKRWKSLGGIDRVPTSREDTTLAWLSIKLLLGVLVDRILGLERGRISPLCSPRRKPSGHRAIGQNPHRPAASSIPTF